MQMRITLRLWQKYNKEHKKIADEYARHGRMNYHEDKDDEDDSGVKPIRTLDKSRKETTKTETALRTPENQAMVNPQDCANEIGTLKIDNQ